MRRLGYLAAPAIIVSLLPALPSSSDEAPSPQSATSFVSTKCPRDVRADGRDIECGYVRVPENRDDPDGRMIKVAAAVLRAPSATTQPDPIVFLDGGPSFGAISSFAVDAYLAGADFAEDRDVILVDTRGTGTSTPRLGCPEFDVANVRSVYAGRRVDSQEVPIYHAALRHCRDRFTDRGIDLAAYNSAESAADLDALRLALGVDDWNLLALSADGTLALTYMRLYPEHIRSAVIDTGMSPQMQWILDYDRGLAEMLDSVFKGCHQNAACQARYPGVRHRFDRMVERLNSHPRIIELPDFRPEPVRVRLAGFNFYVDAAFFIFPGDRSTPPDIPHLFDFVWRATHGHLAKVYRQLIGNGPATNDHTNDFLAQGKSLSYLCHDQINFLTRNDLRDAADDVPAMRRRYLAPNFDLTEGAPGVLSPAGCKIWRVGRADPVQIEPVSSQIPTLVLAAEYDLGVPAFVVRDIGATLPNSYSYEFPASGHLVLASYNTASDCSRTIATAFLDTPTAEPDASCIADLPPFDFTPPDDRGRLVTQHAWRGPTAAQPAL